MPLRSGKITDVVLGFDYLEAYLKSFKLTAPPYFGATVGRFAGRINNSVFNLNGKRFVKQNNNHNSLHGD
jgi:aldose 1-epimerase